MEAGQDFISWLISGCFIVAISYFLYEQSNNIWEKKKIPCLKRKYIFGNIFPAITFKYSIGQLLEDIYRKAGDNPYIGFYVVNKPAILIKDPAIIKLILVRNFDHFVNRNFDIDKELDPEAAQGFLFNTSPRWKHIRTKGTPMFTAARIKFMFSLSSEVADDLVTKITKELARGNVVDVSELTAQYSTDIISSVALGFKANSLTDPNSSYIKFGKRMFEATTYRGYQFLTFYLLPSLAKIFKFRTSRLETVQLLESTFREVFRYREENNVQRNDLVDVLCQLQKEKNDRK